MSLFIRLALPLLVLFCSQGVHVQDQNLSPWSNRQLADRFIAEFTRAMSNSGVLTRNQLKQMASIGESVMRDVDDIARSNIRSNPQLQALNMAFAASIAEIAVSESGDIEVDEMATAVDDSLVQAYLQTTGVVDYQFVNETRDRVLSEFANRSQ